MLLAAHRARQRSSVASVVGFDRPAPAMKPRKGPENVGGPQLDVGVVVAAVVEGWKVAAVGGRVGKGVVAGLVHAALILLNAWNDFW